MVTISPHLNVSNCSTADTTWLRVIYLIETIIGLFSLPIFILLIFLISSTHHKSKYSSPFFIIFRWQTILSICSFFHMHLFIEFPILNIFCDQMLSYLHSFSFYLTPIYFLSYFLQHAHFCLSALISVNRLSAVVLGARYQQVWMLILPWTIGLCFGISLLLSWPLLFSKVALIPMHRGLGMAYDKHIYWIPNSLSTALLCLICALINLFSTVIVLLKIRSYRRYSHSNHLLLVSIVLALISILYSINQLMIFYLLHVKDDLLQNAFTRFYDASFFVNTLATLSPGWTLLILSQQTRVDIIKIITRHPTTGAHKEPLIKVTS